MGNHNLVFARIFSAVDAELKVGVTFTADKRSTGEVSHDKVSPQKGVGLERFSNGTGQECGKNGDRYDIEIILCVLNKALLVNIVG